MRAAVVRAHGGPEALAFEKDFPDPRPGEGDVIVAVKAASLIQFATALAAGGHAPENAFAVKET